MTTAEQNEKAAEFAAQTGAARQKLIEYPTLSGSARVAAITEAYQLIVTMAEEFDVVLGDMQQTS